MELIDTHSHIYDEAFDEDIDAVVERAREAGVCTCILPGIDISSYDRLTSCSDKLGAFVKPCTGLHPTSVAGNWKEELDFVFDHFRDRKFYAIGEIGLDLHWSDEFVREQKIVFESQLDFASRNDLPVIIHLREATDLFFEVMSDMKGVPVKGTMHAFSGSYETYKRILAAGDFKFGIGGVVTYKNAGVAVSLEKMSLTDIVLETDCPWLTPVPHRGTRNESSYVKIVADEVSRIKGLPVEDVAAVTTMNARKLFNLQ